jgi:hypothetical protein
VIPRWLGFKVMISKVLIQFKLTWIPSFSFPTLSQKLTKANKKTLKYICA